MKIQKYLSLFLITFGLFFTNFTYAETIGNANSNMNSREVSSALGGLKNKTYDLTSAPTIRVATFNMAAGKVSDMESIANAIKSMDVDIVALQEVDKLTNRSGKVNQPEILAKLTGMNVAFGRAIDYDDGEYGLAFLSKYPIHDTQIIPLPSGQREQRILFIAQVNIPGFTVPVTIFNTHLDTKENPAIRLEQVQELNDRAMEIRGIKILFGDMNDVPATVTWNELSRYWVDMSINSDDRRSWPAENPEIQVDYIFTGKAQKWNIESLIIPNQTGIWNGTNWPTISDHLPTIIEMKLIEQ